MKMISIIRKNTASLFERSGKTLITNGLTRKDVIRNSKIPKGQTEIVKSRTEKTMANKMKRKTYIEHTTLH